MKKYVDANLDASDNAISDNESYIALICYSLNEFPSLQ